MPHTSLLNFGPWGKGAKLAVLFSMWGKKNLGDPSSQSHISWGMDIKWWESIQDLLHAEPMFSTMDLHLHSSKLIVIARLCVLIDASLLMDTAAEPVELALIWGYQAEAAG